MLDIAKRISSVLVLRGLLALVFGVLMLALPDAAKIDSVILLFGIFAITDGIFAVVGAVASNKSFEDWWLLFLSGVLSVLIGVFTFVHPVKMAIVIVMYVGFRAVLTGILEIAFAIQLRKVISGEWLYVLAGTISILFGLTMTMFPVHGETMEGILVVAWLIGVYAIAAGAMHLVLAGQIREWVKRIQDRKAAETPRV